MTEPDPQQQYGPPPQWSQPQPGPQQPGQPQGQWQGQVSSNQGPQNQAPQNQGPQNQAPQGQWQQGDRPQPLHAPWPQQADPQQQYAQQQQFSQQPLQQPMQPPIQQPMQQEWQQQYPQQQQWPQQQSPQQQWPQQQGAWPSQPGYNAGYPAPQQNGAAPKSKPVALIVGLVVLLVAGGGVGAWLAFGGGKGGSGGTAGGGLHVVWSQPGPSSLPSSDETLGAWVSGGTVAVATNSAITAYALADGKAQWTWKPDAGTKICALSPTVSGGIGAVVAGPDTSTCVDVQAVNLSTGKSVWPHTASLVPQGGDPSDEFPGPFVSGDSVFAEDSALNLDAFDLATGTRRWSSADDSKLSGDDCMVDGAAAIGSAVYAGMSCSDGAFLTGFTPDSGKETTDTALPHACAADTVLKYTWAAGQDAVVDCTDHNGSDKTLAFLIVSPSTGKITPVSLPSVKMDPFIAGSSQDVDYGFAVSGDTLYVETSAGGSDYGSAEVLNAVSLSTGAKKWSKPLAHDFIVVGADASGCLGLAYGTSGGYDLEAMRYASSAGAPATLGTMSDGNEDYSELGHDSTIQVDAGRLVVVGTNTDEMFVSLLGGV